MSEVQTQNPEQSFSEREQSLTSSPSSIPPSYQASLYLSYGLLLTCEELASLFQSLESLGALSIFGSGVLLPKEQLIQTPKSFMTIYQQYLAEGVVTEKEHKAALSSIWSIDPDATYFREIATDKWQVVRKRPVVQLNRFQFRFDDKADRFFTQSFSQETLFWGIEFKYPQIFLDPVTSKLIKVLKTDSLNTQLWKGIHQWIRNHTMPVQFFTDETSKFRVAPFRIGKHGFDLGETTLKRQKSPLQLKRPS